MDETVGSMRLLYHCSRPKQKNDFVGGEGTMIGQFCEARKPHGHACNIVYSWTLDTLRQTLADYHVHHFSHVYRMCVFQGPLNMLIDKCRIKDEAIPGHDPP